MALVALATVAGPRSAPILSSSTSGLVMVMVVVCSLSFASSIIIVIIRASDQSSL